MGLSGNQEAQKAQHPLIRECTSSHMNYSQDNGPLLVIVHIMAPHT